MNNSESSLNRAPIFWSVRLLLSSLLFVGLAIMMLQRASMGVAIVCMINSTALELSNETPGLNDVSGRLGNYSSWRNDSTSVLVESQPQCRFNNRNGENQSRDGPFQWPKSIVGNILSAFFAGYIILMIPAGLLIQKIGGKHVFGFSILIGSVLTILIPFAARYDYRALIACLFLMGMVQGVFLPAISNIWNNWIPASERGRFIGIGFSGGLVGNLIATSLGSYLCENGWDGGWPAIFHLGGALGVFWFIFYTVLTTNLPEKHRFITQLERDYLMKKTPKKPAKNQKKIPLLAMLKSKVVWAIIVTHFGANWCIFFYLTQLPSFLKEILNFNMKSNGLMASIPYILCWIFNVASSFISDYLIQRRNISRTKVRKLFNGLGFFVPMLAISGLILVDCSTPYVGVALLSIGLAFNGCSTVGVLISFNDVAAHHAAILSSISNTLASLSGIIIPIVVSKITVNKRAEEWHIVFGLTSSILLVGFLAFSIFFNSQTEDWARSPEDDESRSKELKYLNEPELS